MNRDRDRRPRPGPLGRRRARIAVRFESKALVASAAHARGRVRVADGDATGAEQSLSEAVRLWNEVGAPYEAATARLCLADARHASGSHQHGDLERQAARMILDEIEGASRVPSTAEVAHSDALDELPGSVNALRREGDYWTVIFDGHTVRVRDLKGTHYLARLVARGQGVHTGAMQRSLRVLCTSTGGVGHVHALAPIARALRDRGHDVQWAVAADGGGAVGAMGFEWSAAGLTTSERYAVAFGLDGLMKLPMEERRGPLFTAVFARAASPVMREDLAPIIDRVRPDLLVRETAELAAARGIPLVTVAFSGVLTLGAVPPNIRVERFVPQGDLLGQASAVVSHGGAGSVLGTAAHGRPQLVVPLFADQWENGVAVDDAGCGIVLGPTRRAIEDLEQALQTLLTGSSHREAAIRVADEIAAMPTATDLAPEIEAIAEAGG